MLNWHSTSGNGNPDYSSDASSTSTLPSRILATPRGSSSTRTARFRTISPEPREQLQPLASEAKSGASSARATASTHKRKSNTPRPIKYQTSRGERREYLRRQIKKAQVTRARATTSNTAAPRRERTPVVEPFVGCQAPTSKAENVSRASLPKILAAPPVHPVAVAPAPFPFVVTGDTGVDVSNLRNMKRTQIDKKRAYIKQLNGEAEQIQETVKRLEGMAEAAKKESEEASGKAKEIEKKVYGMEEKILDDIKYRRDQNTHSHEARKGRELVQNATENMKEISRLMDVAKMAEFRKTSLWNHVNDHRRLVTKRWEVMGKTMEEIGRLWTELERI
ncbi:uncharacterized protein STEHIDRAFT_171280 [Stereum hirsutum FP-91666 SS1]|uniref:uncharacterized protein n=1 Tax=Stereum hirsutum (strain FP-91666) TaxID=721885 RepID=UPI000444A797|nr:uncharacterized protein STEHIDRAFT_171280 [Stereum hirsutum FP-91666 SS1]EIM82326.1 hypothetical protein STEHIDRAFT_171280 [Stereum hirsutum FP-91666 SS1]